MKRQPMLRLANSIGGRDHEATADKSWSKGYGGGMRSDLKHACSSGFVTFVSYIHIICLLKYSSIALASKLKQFVDKLLRVSIKNSKRVFIGLNAVHYSPLNMLENVQQNDKM